MKKLFTLLIAGLFTLSAMAQTTYYVKADGSDANAGTSWDNAFATITKAISSCVKDDEIRVAQGTFNSTATYTIDKSLTIKGSYGADGVQNYSNKTVLDGKNAFRIMRSVWLTYGHVPEVKVDGFTFTNANSTGYSGAAVFDKCNGIISNCSFINNASPTYGGGGLSFNNATIKSSIINCDFHGNSGKDGGAILVGSNEILDVINCTIANNTCGSGDGGGIFCNGTLNLKNSIVWGNMKGENNNQIKGSGTLNIERNLVKEGKAEFAGTVNLVNDESIDAKNVDPLFLDATNGDLRLGTNSPAINAGKNDLFPSTILVDLNNNTRIFNTTIDLGCYELNNATGFQPVNDSRIQVYPNPTSDYLTINLQSQEQNIQLRDLTGKTILFQSVKAGERTVILDIRKMSKGVYLLSAGTSTHKVVIQ